MSEERYYTIEQVAEMFSVTRATVYNWINSGRLKWVRVGGRRRITQSAINAFIRPGDEETSAQGREEETRMPVFAAA